MTSIPADAARRRALLARESELNHLMRNWRERLDPKSIPGLVTRARSRTCVTQEVMAQLVGVSPLWYGKLERGELTPNYSEDFLEKVVYALRLNSDERNVLFHLALGRPPAPRYRPSKTAVSPSMEHIIERQPWPAYISDGAWDVLVHNDAMAAWFPHMAYETNIMRWVFNYPESQLQLVDWETCWAPLMLAQMRAAHARWPDNRRLDDLIVETLSVNASARKLWDDDPRVYVHPDGDRRKLHIPYFEAEREIEIVAMTPMRAEDLRIVMLIPIDEDTGDPR